MANCCGAISPRSSSRRATSTFWGSRAGKRSHADLEDEIRQLRERNQAQQLMIRNLEEQSSRWEALAETKAELVRNVRIELSGDPDADNGDEEDL